MGQKARGKRKAADQGDVGGDAKRIRTTAAAPSPVPGTRVVHVPVGGITKFIRVAVKGADEAPAAPSQVLSHFERLPGEVRNLIYHHALVADKSIIPRVDKLPRGSSHPPRADIPAETLLGLALGTDKAISREVLTYFYGENKFTLSLPYHKPWVNRIGRRNAACIRALTLHCEGNPNQARTYMTEMQNALMKRCINLRTIEYNCGWLLSPQMFYQVITAKHIIKTWSQFRSLTTINLQHHQMPENGFKETSPAWELLVKLCKQCEIKVVATHRQSTFLNDKVALEWKDEKVVKVAHSKEQRRD